MQLHNNGSPRDFLNARLPRVWSWMAVAAIPLAFSSCASRTVDVAIAFDNDWRAGQESLTSNEPSLIRRTAVQTLQHAFSGFGVRVSEGRGASRLVVVDNGYVAGLGPVGQPAPAGEVYPFARVSRVHFDETVHTLLAAVGCDGIATCGKPRAEMVTALGRGIGATAAHELGHQIGFRFSVDSRCEDCYDSHSSNSSAHFFGTLHWSDRAIDIMRRVLPPDAAR